LVKKVPTESEWKTAYEDGATRKGEKWFNKFTTTTGIAAAASSDDAQKRFTEKMSKPEILALRQKKLRALTDEDFHAPVRRGGSALYTSAITAKSDKAAKGVAPFLSKIGEVLPTLKPKTDDVDANIDGRVKPIAKALRALKRGK
jgi:hypothetical protein